MTATNHVITGVVIGAVAANPVIALPIAVLSHFVLDALPHFGGFVHTSRAFLYSLSADMAAAAGTLLVIILLRPTHWPVLVMAGIAAASPDLMWFPRWLNELRGKANKPMDQIARFHSAIQRSETKKGILVEIVWFLSIGYLLLKVW